ncbi:uncharacterized protein N0V89_007461 [Didymosphaeria variabile]|uniref:Fungal STAND N-terminal Goodbye domain-containing protein n=1 Tax=Didymosphaeria variabile TaxID=1932322 RepID=A0A9W8XLJ5_9PLEO|nr:uncharacterized protein N0V89_007461 [Didymosphaeria variabile]KAJ4352115.1 hypothetical protein N0V89_007461 [Didymosphaeria variabile]
MVKKGTDVEPFFSADKDLNEVWPEVIAEYERVTEKKLDPNTTFESFQQIVNERLREATSKRSSHARTVLNNVGACIANLGSILADGASMAFGPSAQCWNAINFVIIAARKYSDVLEGFVTLMERCAAFLSRLNIFLKQEVGKARERLPNHLRRPCYDILSHFINVLKSSYKLSTSKREKFKLVLEIVLFSGDAGVQSSLDLLERQVQDFTNVQIDQILVDVKGLARYLRDSDEVRQQHQSEIREYMESIYKVSEETLAIAQQMKTSLDGRISQDKNKEDLEKIRKAFDLKSNEETWIKRHNHLCKVRIADSGRWLVERDDLGFSAWADAHDHQNKAKILTIEGDSGFGKTYVSCNAISHLQDIYRSNNSSDRVLIAYYYYGENRQDGEDKEDSLERCMRCIVYQLAVADPAYARAVAEACQHSSGIARAEEIWDRFIVRLQHAMKGTYYICIDGFASQEAEELVTTIAQNVLCDIKGISIRLYFSGTHQLAARIPQDDHGVRRILLGPVKDLGNKMVRLGAGEIEETSTFVSLINASDLEAVARARVEDIGKKKPDLKNVMTEENIKKLVAGVHGHYDHLEAKMIQIDTCDSEQKVLDVIASIGDDLKTSISNSLKVFSESLNAEQTRQINELLVWVVGGKNISIEFLQSALYSAFHRTFMLRDLIATTFSGLLTLDEYSNVRLKSDQLLEVLREENKSHLKLSRTGLNNVELTQAEIDLCSHIVKNVCGKHVYGRFNFDDYFSSLAGKQRASVQVDDERPLDVIITRTCLETLCTTNDEEHLNKLRRYASVYFYEHLQYFVEKLDYFEPDRESLTVIGSKLSQLLYDADAIVDFWLKEDFLSTVRADFVFNDAFFEPTIRFLRNPHAALGYQHDLEKARWVESVISAKSNKYAILERVTSSLAKKWFDCKTMTDPDSFWLSYEHYEAALTAFKESEKELGDNWIVLLQIGETYAGLKQFTAALEYLHKVKAKHPELIDTDKDFKDVYWDRILLPEGNFHRELRDIPAAIKCYQDILAQDAEQAGAYHADALAALFALWIEIGDSDSIVSFLRDKRAEKTLSYWLGNIIGSRDDVHNNIIKAAKQSTAVEEVSQMYDEVIDPTIESSYDDSDDEKSSEQKASDDANISRENLRFFRAMLNFHVSERHHEHEKALEVWEQMVFNPSNTSDAYWVAYKARRLLARALLDKGAAEATTAGYVTRLEALCRSNQENVRGFRQSQHDPCICLARLHLLKDSQKLADEEARTLLRGVFDNWPEDLNDPSLSMRFGVLAQILAIFNMDDDAIAAWQALKPRQVERTATEKAEDVSETQSTLTQDKPAEFTVPTIEAYICGYVCDNCNTTWDNMLADCWDCKHCLCVQLCTPCHEKLLADEISPLVCSKEHEFLYLPKYDEEKWSSLPDDSIVVGGKSIPREEWLKQFRERFEVKQEDIDAYKLETARKLKATVCIAKYVLKWKRKRSERQKKMKRARTFPMLNGH